MLAPLEVSAPIRAPLILCYVMRSMVLVSIVPKAPSSPVWTNLRVELCHVNRVYSFTPKMLISLFIPLPHHRSLSSWHFCPNATVKVGCDAGTDLCPQGSNSRCGSYYPVCAYIHNTCMPKDMFVTVTVPSSSMPSPSPSSSSPCRRHIFNHRRRYHCRCRRYRSHHHHH